MYCQKCGKEISEDIAFCPSCGTKFADNRDSQINASEKKSVANGKKMKKKTKIIIAVLCVFILLIILLASVDDGSWEQLSNPGNFNFDTPVTEQTTEFVE